MDFVLILLLHEEIHMPKRVKQSFAQFKAKKLKLKTFGDVYSCGKVKNLMFERFTVLELHWAPSNC